MQNMRSYFSSWKPFWKTTPDNPTVKLAPSSINFTDSSLGDLKNSIVDEQLMIELSTKLIQSISPPKLQICAHENQWFALNNSHLLIYRQLERVGLCQSVVCDVIRTEDVPIGIRQTLKPVQGQENDPEDHVSDPNEVVYCADMQADSCGYFEDEEPFDESNASGAVSEQADSDDERNEWPVYPSNFTEVDLDNDSLEEPRKELESLL